MAIRYLLSPSFDFETDFLSYKSGARWIHRRANLSYRPHTTSHSTNWGCSESRIVLETAETGILAFLKNERRFSQAA